MNRRKRRLIAARKAARMLRRLGAARGIVLRCAGAVHIASRNEDGSIGPAMQIADGPLTLMLTPPAGRVRG